MASMIDSFKFRFKKNVVLLNNSLSKILLFIYLFNKTCKYVMHYRTRFVYTSFEYRCNKIYMIINYFNKITILKKNMA